MSSYEPWLSAVMLLRPLVCSLISRDYNVYISYFGFDTDELCLLEETKDPVMEDCLTEDVTIYVWRLLSPLTVLAPPRTWAISGFFFYTALLFCML